MTASSLLEQPTSHLPVPFDWNVKRIGTFTTKVGSGATPRGGKSAYLDSRMSHALIRSQHVFDRRFESTGLAFISKEHSDELRNAEVRSGDILLNITGDGVTFARSCIVPDEILPACVNQHVSIIRVDRNACVPGYLLAFLTHPLTKRYIESFNTGGSRRAITKGHIESFEVPLPPLPVQRRIAGILSAYDELIENNQRRIKILETMARSLYREWFVNFRFPGHDKVKMVPSPLGQIPQGWEIRTIADLCESVSYGYTASAVREDIGPKFLRITDIVPDIIEWDRVPFCEIPVGKVPKYLVKPGDIVIARTGATTGYAKRLNKRHPEAVFASYLVRVRVHTDVSNLDAWSADRVC